MWFPNRYDTNLAAHIHLMAIETGNFGLRKKRDCTIHVVKTKALISFTLAVKLICVFVFAYANCWFSHEAAHISNLTEKIKLLQFRNMG